MEVVESEGEDDGRRLRRNARHEEEEEVEEKGESDERERGVEGKTPAATSNDATMKEEERTRSGATIRR